MDSSLSDSVLNVLQRTSKGKATFPELATALRSLEGMCLVIPPQEFGRFTEDLNAALEEKGQGNVTVKDAEVPKFIGLTTPEGAFVPRAFTDDTLAREYAVTSGLIEPDGSLFFVKKDWVSGLHEFLAKGWDGVIIDSDSDHQVNLPRKPLARLLAVMTLEELAYIPYLHVVTHENKVHTQRSEGESLLAFAFDNDEAARCGVQGIQAGNGGAATQKTPTPELLQILLGIGVDTLIVNPGLGDERPYSRGEIRRMKEMHGNGNPLVEPAPADPAPAGAATQAAAVPAVDPSLDPGRAAADRAVSGSPQLPGPMVRAASRPTRPLVPPPDITDEESRNRFIHWHERATSQAVEPWQMTEALSYELRVYTPIHFRNVEGLYWPQFFKHPTNEGETASYLYTNEAALREALKTSPPESRRFHLLSGIEALRWVWAAPGDIGHVAFDWPKPRAWFSCPTFWALNPIFPGHMEIKDLDKVPGANLAKVGGLPGARGLKPQVVKALLGGWRQLLTMRREGERSPSLIEHQGGRYLAAFSGQEQFLACTSTLQGFQGAPVDAGREAPFAAWLEAATECAGVVLDPAGPHPLALDHFDLMALGLWCRKGYAQPSEHDLVSEAGRLCAEKKIPPRLAGRMAAEIPRYWMGVQKKDDSVLILVIPGTDTCALFSNPDSARSYLDFYRNLGIGSDEMKPVPVLSRWDRSALHTAAESFEAVWIDPAPMGGGGLYLEREALEAALEHLDRKLKPRVPGFVWEG